MFDDAQAAPLPLDHESDPESMKKENLTRGEVVIGIDCSIYSFLSGSHAKSVGRSNKNLIFTLIFDSPLNNIMLKKVFLVLRGRIFQSLLGKGIIHIRRNNKIDMKPLFSVFCQIW